MHIVYLKSGLWVYNVFNVLNVPQRILFLIVSVATGCLFYLLGDKLNAVIWGKTILMSIDTVHRIFNLF